MMEIKTANTILYCKKWKETVAFYETRLGLQVVTSRDWFVEFRLNETSRLSIADEARASIGSSDGQGLTLAMEVDDIEATHLVLSRAGAHPTPIKNHAWGARIVHLHDPEGNRLEFWSSTAKPG